MVMLPAGDMVFVSARMQLCTSVLVSVQCWNLPALGKGGGGGGGGGGRSERKVGLSAAGGHQVERANIREGGRVGGT